MHIVVVTTFANLDILEQKDHPKVETQLDLVAKLPSWVYRMT
jgi:hypothetical protein